MPTWQPCTEYRLSEAIIQNDFYGAYTVPPVQDAIESMVHTLYHPLRRGKGLCSEMPRDMPSYSR